MLLFFIHRSLNPGPLQFVKAHVKSQIALIRFASAAADLVHGEAEIGSRLLDGDASLRVLPEVLARGGYRSSGSTIWFAPSCSSSSRLSFGCDVHMGVLPKTAIRGQASCIALTAATRPDARARRHRHSGADTRDRRVQSPRPDPARDPRPD